MAKDYYATLGVSKDASKDELKKAYKKLAKQYHPDLHKGDKAKERKFKEINEAYKVLSNDKARTQYDRFGSADFNQSGFNQGFSDFDFGDIFSNIFGGNFGFGGRRQARRGHDLQYGVEITLEEAFAGLDKTITLDKFEVCSHCQGSGAEHVNDVVTCDDCQGHGYVKRTQRTPFGLFATTATCKRCQGSGNMVKEHCHACYGEGKVRKKKSIEVSIPAGIDTGHSLRIAGEGEPGDAGQPPGDLYVVVRVASHDLFSRKGDDIHVEISIPFTVAALGGEIDVPTLESDTVLSVPSGTQTNTIFRMKGKGMPHLQGRGRGDEMVMVVVHTPEKLTKKQKEILHKFAKAGGDKVKPLKKGFFEKILSDW